MEKDKFIMKIITESFEQVDPYQFAKQLKICFNKDPSLWFQRITPRDKALELMQITNGDYSEIWEDYCVNCFKTINKKTKQKCFVSEDKLTWLCSDCYFKLFPDKQ